jgi:hypothetical protein
MPVSEQAPAPSPPRRLHWAPRLVGTVAVALLIGWSCGAAMRADARLASPPGFFRGLLHGGMMPVAWPTLLAGQDQDIYASRNEGRTYKLGYSMGVNLSGLIFFGWLFLTVGSLKSLHQRSRPQ